MRKHKQQDNVNLYKWKRSNSGVPNGLAIPAPRLAPVKKKEGVYGTTSCII